MLGFGKGSKEGMGKLVLNHMQVKNSEEFKR